MQYGESANGTEVEVRANEEFQIALPETRTAGFRWTVAASPGGHCELVEDKAEPNTRGVGGSGTHLWRFRATSPGVCLIELHYVRTWEKTSGPAKTFKLNVRVRP